MENLQGRNSSGSNGRFLQNNTETENLSGGPCGKVVAHAGASSEGAKKNDCSCSNSVGSGSSWLTCAQQHMHNNNNNISIDLNGQAKCNVGVATTPLVASSSVTVANDTTDASYAGTDGGNVVSSDGAVVKDDSAARNTAVAGCADSQENHAAGIDDIIAIAPQEAAGAACTATSYEHACTFDAFRAAAAAAAAAISRSASVNNSTENLSFNSDNFYADDLLLLEGDDDIDDVEVDGEELSLNSDDCVYAYRGDGADFELALDPLDGRRLGTSNNCMMDDETDFLEMDFEPDPLSEVEYGSLETSAGHADAFLIQRDACHLSGRHSATLGHYSAAGVTEQRQLFSSPIDDILAAPPTKNLQSQLMLSKNFARITMHLDQIKGENGDCDAYNRTTHSEHTDAVDTASSSTINTAHSLPNTLVANFGRDLLHAKEADEKVVGMGSAMKVTGAKPKRFPTFSTSSSTSSKNSSKSRNSLRASYAAPTLCNSVSFDERSASCNEFRNAAVKLQAVSTEDGMYHPETSRVLNTSATNTTTKDCDDLCANDDSCLDCLEKEFLANTIGKTMDAYECTRCRKRSSSSMALFKRAAAQTSAIGPTRCRSGSPLLFRNGRDDDGIFEKTTVADYLQQPRNVDWASTTFRDIGMIKADSNVGGNSVSYEGVKLNLIPRVRTRVRARTCDANVLQQFQSEEKSMSQRRTADESGLESEHLLKNLLLTEKEAVTVSTLNLSEELLVQALDKLHVSYNLELFKSHLCYGTNAAATTTTVTTNPPVLSAHKNLKDFKDLKDLLMFESKKHCNHPKLKRLIELATRQQVEVQFQQDPKENSTALVPVKVADILQIWLRTKNLTVLKRLEKRYIEANVLGKIANIIRQAQQRCTQRRPLPDFILIPQYYPCGILKLTKKF